MMMGNTPVVQGLYSGSLSTGSPAGQLVHLKRASWLNVQSGHSKAGELYKGSLGYPECANHLGRAVPELKGNTEKVARAVAIAENVKFRSTDNLVPRRLLDTHIYDPL